MQADVLAILACPYCVTRPVPGTPKLARAKLELKGPAEKPTGLKCADCGRVYALLEGGLPNLLVDEATLEPK
jgi:uncharacterized protein YbaR (Trm112 family)